MAIMGESSLRDYYKNSSKSANGLRTFNQLFGSIGLQEESSLRDLKYDYTEAMNDAYKKAYESSIDITSSNIGEGYKDLALKNIDNSLLDAYNSYKQNYMNSYQSIVDNANEARSNISGILDEQAKNAENLRKSTYSYLEYLYESHPEMFKKEYKDTDYWYNLMSYDSYGKIDKIMPEDMKKLGNNGRLINEEELNKILYDENGYVTVKGQEFFDRILNSGSYASGEFVNYDDWLYNQSLDEKGDYYGLYDWYNSFNPYDYRPDDVRFNGGLPTNASFIRTAFGLVSSDRAYSFAERFGGLTEDELNKYFEPFKNRLDSLNKLLNGNEYGKNNGKLVKENVIDLLKDIKSLSYKFGLEDSIGSDIDTAIEKISKLNVKSMGEMTGEWFGITLGSTALGAGAGAAGGGVTGTSIGGPLGGGVLAIIGAIIGGAAGLIGGAIGSSINTDVERTSNKDVAVKAKDAYNQILTLFINEAQSQRSKSQKEYSQHVI